MVRRCAQWDLMGKEHATGKLSGYLDLKLCCQRRRHDFSIKRIKCRKLAQTFFVPPVGFELAVLVLQRFDLFCLS